MVCNAAVSITRAALSDDRLKALIDEHLDEVTEIMRKYLHSRHPMLSLGSPSAGQFRVGDGLTLKIEGGSVTISGQRNAQTTQYIEDLSSETSTFLTLVADQLFTRHVENRLKVVAKITGKIVSDVTNRESVQRATVYEISINSLKARVFVLPGGRLQVFVDTGSFSQAKAATLELLAGMQTQSLSSLRMEGEVEQHRSDVDHVHVRHTQLRGGS